MQLKQWRNRENNEADLLTKRRQALCVEKSRLKDYDPAETQEGLAQIEESIKGINARLKEFVLKSGRLKHMDILAKVPRELKAQVFFFMRHPVAEIYRPIWLQPAWYRDAIGWVHILKWLEQSLLCEDYDSMGGLLVAIDTHVRFLKFHIPPGRRNTLELPPQMERRLCLQARVYKRIHLSLIHI